jgi:hypothetical protein
MGGDIVGPVTELDYREFGCVIAAIALNVLKIDYIRRIVFGGSMVVDTVLERPRLHTQNSE